MNNTINKMANENSFADDILASTSNSDVDEFEQMLSDFIAKEFDDELQETQQEIEEIEDKMQASIDDDELLNPSTEEPASTQLNEHEFSLFRAYNNYLYAINILCEENKIKKITPKVTEESLYPHYKKRVGNNVSQDILSGWDILMKIFPSDMQTINPDSTDDQLLDFAERCDDENLQLSIISFVETMIELEGCEIDYEARKIKYERKQLEKQIYQEHQRRLERRKKFIQAIQDKNFPVDAERLINNYFRLSNKDPEGSFKALTANPATFAPIDFSKMKDKLFGLIKIKPSDGIRINQKLGNFLKKLKA